MSHSVSDEPPRIPPELVDEIIDCSASDKSMLATWARVSHSCATRTRPYLFHDVTLRISRLLRFEKILPTIARHIYRLEIIVDGRAKVHVLHGVNRALDLLVDSGTDPHILCLVNVRFVRHGDIGICSWVPVTRFKHLEELVLMGCKFETFGDFDALLHSFPLLSHIALEDLNAHSRASALPLGFERNHMNLHHFSVKNICWFAGPLNESLLATVSTSQLRILQCESDGSPSDRDLLGSQLRASSASLQSLKIGLYLTHPAQAEGKVDINHVVARLTINLDTYRICGRISEYTRPVTVHRAPFSATAHGNDGFCSYCAVYTITGIIHRHIGSRNRFANRIPDGI